MSGLLAGLLLRRAGWQVDIFEKVESELAGRGAGIVAQPDAGYIAWRALIAEAAFPPAIHAQLFDAMTFCLPPGEQFLGYPVAGPNNDLRPGHRRYNIVWYRPAAEATELQDLLTDEKGR